MRPTSKTDTYTIKLDDRDDEIEVKPDHVFNEHNVPSSGKPSDTLKFFRPDWLRRDQKVMLLHDDFFEARVFIT